MFNVPPNIITIFQNFVIRGAVPLAGYHSSKSIWAYASFFGIPIYFYVQFFLLFLILILEAKTLKKKLFL